MKKNVQEMVREQIRLRSFLPVIRKVMDVKEKKAYVWFTVRRKYAGK